MKDAFWPLLAAVSVGSSLLACTQGGQTYDDGSDGVRSSTADEFDEDAGAPAPVGPTDPAAPTADVPPMGMPTSGSEEMACAELDDELGAARVALVDAADRGCNLDMDCIVTASTPSCMDSCNGDVLVSQSGVDAIARGLAELEATLCADFENAGCTFFPSGCPGVPPRMNRCVDGQCSFVAGSQPPAAGAGGDGGTGVAGSGVLPSPSGSGGGGTSGEGGGSGSADCFGPEQNVGQAYSGELPGCACGDVGGICIDGVALDCNEGVWWAVEDGACEPGFLDQPCDGRVQTVATCLELFELCRNLDNGLFCGQGRRTELCDGGEIVTDAAGCLQDDAFCTELDNGLYCTGPAAPSCPEGFTPIDDCPLSVPWCFQYSESLACRVPDLTSMACEEQGGTVVADPGDGSVYSVGCPDSGAVLGTVTGCFEGCLCCGARTSTPGSR